MNIGPSTNYIQNFLVSFEVTEMLRILKQINTTDSSVEKLKHKKVKNNKAEVPESHIRKKSTFCKMIKARNHVKFQFSNLSTFNTGLKIRRTRNQYNCSLFLHAVQPFPCLFLLLRLLQWLWQQLPLSPVPMNSGEEIIPRLKCMGEWVGGNYKKKKLWLQMTISTYQTFHLVKMNVKPFRALAG